MIVQRYSHFPSRLTVPDTFERLPNLFEAHSSLRALLTSTCEGKTTKRPLSLNLQGDCSRFTFNRTEPWSEECNLRRFRNADCFLGSLHHGGARRHPYLHLRSSCFGLGKKQQPYIHQTSRVGYQETHLRTCRFLVAKRAAARDTEDRTMNSLCSSRG